MGVLLAWLDLHAAAVQAAASVVSAILTLVLVCVTVMYVRLTWQLALAATAQERRAQVADQSRRAAFTDLLTRLRAAVDSLPREPQRQMGDRDLRAVRAAVLWTESDLEEFAGLAPAVKPHAGPDVGRLVGDLQWLAKQAKEVQTTDRREAFQWAQFPWHEWEPRLAHVREALARFAE